MRVAILGATGRMGTTLTRLIAASSDCTLSGAATEPGHGLVGKDAGLAAGSSSLNVLIVDSPVAAVTGCDVAIDFSAAAATDANVAACRERRCALVLGTTGLAARQLGTLAQAAHDIPIVYGRNMSVGVLVLTELGRIAARLLGQDADIEIIETHHRGKADAPSGTALQIGEAIAAELGTSLSHAAIRDRASAPGLRRSGSIGISSVRGGTIVGDHEVVFALDEEVISLGHRAQDRAIFARGALRATRWVAGRPAGLYSMADVLGLT